MLADHLSRPTKALLQDVDRLGVVLWGEGDSLDGVPRRPLGVGQQIGEFGGVVQVSPFVHICLELGPKCGEFQHFPRKLRESYLRQPPVAGPDRRHASTNTAATDRAFSARLNHPCACSRLPHSVVLAT
ncbi:hypothetical protein T02_16132 [Trichinella nativa]|uniref:Uncharacterized protein n=2 Tax=Trichinella nativa TaxID=6335 RepID=A0A0V1LGG6_9BILA|nr:hypothetical protein T02_3447 [Trichinella nativa]KRZ62432.1 hypothetical protein T02_16132 [Trichinella nativa]